MIPGRKKESKYLYLNYALLSVFMFFLFTYLYWKATPDQSARLGTYVSVLTLIIFTITGIIAVLNFRMQIEDRNRSTDLQYVNLIQNRSNQVDRLFMNNDTLDRLYAEMYYDNPNVQQLVRMQNPKKNEVTFEVLKAEHHAANIIFQSMIDIFTTANLDVNSLSGLSWIYTFKKWMRSNILRKQWNAVKYEYPPKFIHFMDNILIQKLEASTNILISR